MAGLAWLARVGPCPLAVWGLAMGWAPSTQRSHVTRLLRAGWIQRSATRHGSDALLYATRQGVAVCGVPAAPVANTPAPTTWAHHEACAWTAAWLTVRGRQLIGPREILGHDELQGEIQWADRAGSHRLGHRPDLAARIITGGPVFTVEVELARKSIGRLRAVLALHAVWIASRQTAAVIYVCQTTQLAARVRAHAEPAGLAEHTGRLRVELLETIVAQTRAARQPEQQAA